MDRKGGGLTCCVVEGFEGCRYDMTASFAFPNLAARAQASGDGRIAQIGWLEDGDLNSMNVSVTILILSDIRDVADEAVREWECAS